MRVLRQGAQRGRSARELLLFQVAVA